MNKTTIAIIMIILNFSCASSQENDQVVEETTVLQQTTPFNQLEVKVIDKVILVQGTTPSITIIKGSEYQSLLEMNTVNGKLTINKKQTKDKKQKNKPIYLKITYTNLNQISLINLGSVSCENAMNSKDLNIKTQNTASVKLNINCDKLNLSCVNSANITLTGQSKTNEIDVKNTADVNLDLICNSLNLTSVNSANVTIAGQAKTSEFNIENASDIDFSTFNVEEMNLTAINGASGKINTSGKLSLMVKNYASFTVKGNPTILKKEIKNVANFKM